jgi:hypothetical protein
MFILQNVAHFLPKPGFAEKEIGDNRQLLCFTIS